MDVEYGGIISVLFLCAGIFMFETGYGEWVRWLVLALFDFRI